MLLTGCRNRHHDKAHRTIQSLLASHVLQLWEAQWIVSKNKTDDVPVCHADCAFEAPQRPIPQAPSGHGAEPADANALEFTSPLNGVTVQEVLLFPAMKPHDDAPKEAKEAAAPATPATSS